MATFTSGSARGGGSFKDWTGPTRARRLEYWMEQQININVFRLFVKCPKELQSYASGCSDGENILGRAPAPHLPSLLLNIDPNNKTASQSLDMTRTSLRISFDLLRGANDAPCGDALSNKSSTTFLLELDFHSCEIDPQKCTVDRLDRHWVFRLPFYYPGCVTRTDRMGRARTGELYVPSEAKPCVERKAIGCANCDNDFLRHDAVQRVKQAPSPYWSSLSNFWYCLQSQGAKRSEEAAPGGLIRIPDNTMVVDQESILVRENILADRSAVKMTHVQSKADESFDEKARSGCAQDAHHDRPPTGVRDDMADSQNEKVDRRNYLDSRNVVELSKLGQKDLSIPHTATHITTKRIKSWRRRSRKNKARFGCECLDDARNGCAKESIDPCSDAVKGLKGLALGGSTEELQSCAVTCSKCDSLVGASEIRHGHLVIRFYKHRLRHYENIYTVDSVVGHSMLHGFMGKNIRRFSVYAISATSNGELGTREYRVEDTPRLHLSLFDSDVKCSSHENIELQDSIKVLYSAATEDDRNREGLGGERLLLSATDCDLLLQRLESTNKHFPISMSSMQFRKKMKVGVLYW